MKKRAHSKAKKLRVASPEPKADLDVFARTAGAWKRDESPEETIEKIRAAFRRSMERHRAIWPGPVKKDKEDRHSH